MSAAGYLRLAIYVGIACVVIGFPVLLFAVAMLEKRRTRLLVRTQEGAARPVPDDYKLVFSAAQAAGFEYLGIFSDGDKGWKEGFVDLFLSADHTILLWVQRRLPKRYKLITRLDQQRWILTVDIKGERDLSGLRQEVMLPDVSFEVLHFAHQERLLTEASAPLPFGKATVLEEIAANEMHRVDRLVEMGLARYINAEQETWKYTFRGAVQTAMGSSGRVASVSQAMEAAKATKARYEASKEHEALNR